MSAGWRERPEERRALGAVRVGHVSQAGGAGQRREPTLLLLRHTSFSLHETLETAAHIQGEKTNRLSYILKDYLPFPYIMSRKRRAQFLSSNR